MKFTGTTTALSLLGLSVSSYLKNVGAEAIYCEPEKHSRTIESDTYEYASKDMKTPIVTVEIKEVLSKTKESPTNWGWNDKTIWVADGFRAKFHVYTQNQDKGCVTTCVEKSKEYSISSNDNKSAKQEIASTRTPLNVEIKKVVSDTDSVPGNNWGWDQKQIWVDDGLRADFTMTYTSDPNNCVYRQTGPQCIPNSQFIQVSSNDFKKVQSDKIDGNIITVYVTEIRSDVIPTDDTYWGWKDGRIWVDKGFRANFIVLTDPKESHKLCKPLRTKTGPPKGLQAKTVYVAQSVEGQSVSEGQKENQAIEADPANKMTASANIFTASVVGTMSTVLMYAAALL